MKILVNPVEVDNRLESLGFMRSQIIEIAEAMAGAKAECTDNDPPGSIGWSAYRTGTRRLREVKASDDDWDKDDTDQIASVVNRKLGLRVIIANTDDGTGRKDGAPQNCSRKGAASDRVVADTQATFFDELDTSIENGVRIHPSDPALRAELLTYYICVHAEGDKLRVELSCPVSVKSGYFKDFIERVVVVGIDDDSGPEPSRRQDHDEDDGDADVFDIPVNRKQ